MSKSEFATVDDVIEILKKASDEGLGDYCVICNLEYAFAKKGDTPDVNHVKKFIDLGGYT